MKSEVAATAVDALPADLVSAADFISIEALRSLSVINGWRVARAIVANWLLLLACLGIALWADHAVVYVASALVVANRQYALLLLVHECAHYLFRRRNTEGQRLRFFTNDRIGNVFCAWPVGITVERYRELHFQHHKHLGTDRDPDHEYYRERLTPGELVRLVLGGLFGVRALLTVALYYLPGVAKAEPKTQGRPRKAGSALLGIVVTQLVILGAFLATGPWWSYLALWLLPVLTVVPTLNHLRTRAEHTPDLPPPGAVPVPITRSNITNLFEQELLGPVQFFYHHEHHLYPSVPFYNLVGLHRLLVEASYYERYQGPLQGSYVRTLRKLSQVVAPPPVEARGSAREQRQADTKPAGDRGSPTP